MNNDINWDKLAEQEYESLKNAYHPYYDDDSTYEDEDEGDECDD